MSLNEQCMIWGTPATILPAGSRDGWRVFSPRAGGEYFISRRAQEEVSNFNERDKAKLTSWLYQRRRSGTSCPEVNSQMLEGIGKSNVLLVATRLRRILRQLNARTPLLGTEVRFLVTSGRVLEFDTDTPRGKFISEYFELLACSESIGESDFLFLLEHLAKDGLVTNSGKNEKIKGCTLTVDGLRELTESEQVKAEVEQAFVAMWFDDSTENAWLRGIEPAIRAAGYSPMRIDEKEHSNKIDDEIVAELRRSRFVVADFTHGSDGARGGVYYEAGFAHGLNVPVIFCCHKDKFRNVHFDTRQYNHIVWSDPADLRKQLEARICAVIGDGPGKMH